MPEIIFIQRSQEIVFEITKQETVFQVERVVNNATGGGAWGEIEGNIADQLDLQAALDARATVVYVDALFSTKTTDDLDEGSINLYWTSGRFDSAFAAKSTTNLSEGTNQYWTNARFDSRFSLKTTTDLAEGANMYWTNARGDARIAAAIGVTVQAYLGYTAENVASKNAANGYAGLDAGGLIPSSLLPSYVDDVLEYANLAAFPGTGETSKIYTAIDTLKIYRWSGSVYVEISGSPGSTDSVPEGSVNLYWTAARFNTAFAGKTTSDLSEGGNKYFTEARVLATVLAGLDLSSGAAITASDSVLSAFGKLQKQITNHLADNANPHGVTKSQVGLGNVPNIDSSVDYLSCSVDGQGGVISTGSKGFITNIPFPFTISKWRVVGNASGSIQFDIKVGGTSIIGGSGNKPLLSSAQRNNAAVASWTTTTFAANTELEIIVDSASTLTWAGLSIEIAKT